MTQLVTIQQAARDSLAAWLTSDLPGTDILIEPRWVESDQQLPPKRITIIDAGPRTIEWLQTEILQTTNVDTENGLAVKKVDAVWGFGEVTQPIQLDVWAQSDVELDDILARLDGSLNKGARGLGVANVDLFSAGILLPLAGDWAPGTVNFSFEEPSILQTPSSVGEGEWRATIRGAAQAQLVQTARSARIARILLQQRLYERDPVDTTDPPDVTIITSAS